MAMFYYPTPLLYSYPLSKITSQNIWLKMECYQPSGSFKMRGMEYLCRHYCELGLTQLVASSGGNAGYSAAYIAKHLDIPITVFVPSNTHKIYLDKIRSLGATVNIAGTVWDEAHQAALTFAKEENAGYVPPFDHPLIWLGNSTIMDEVVAAGVGFDAVVLAVGGGGLAVGVLQGLARNNLENIPVYGVETLGAASFQASLNAKELVTLPSITSIATTLGAKRICRELFELSQKRPIYALQVSDQQAVHACQRFLNDHLALVEPACGAALAVVYDQYPELTQYKNILVIVCGGVGISDELLREYAAGTSIK